MECSSQSNYVAVCNRNALHLHIQGDFIDLHTKYGQAVCKYASSDLLSMSNLQHNPMTAVQSTWVINPNIFEIHSHYFQSD